MLIFTVLTFIINFMIITIITVMVSKDRGRTWELLSVYGAHARAVVVDNVPALDHEVLDDPVEGGLLEAHGDAVLLGFPRAELAKVLGRLGHDVSEELHLDAAELDAAGGDVHEDDGIVRVEQLLLQTRKLVHGSCLGLPQLTVAKVDVMGLIANRRWIE